MRFLFIFMLVSKNLYAQENLGHMHGSHTECELPKTTMDVIRCAVRSNPEAQRAILATAQASTLPDAEGQFPNPELDVDIANGKDNANSTEIGLLQKIQWGGKRSSKIDSARAQVSLAEAMQNDVQADVIRETVKNLYRLRQLEFEKSILNNTIQTLQKIISQQASRPTLPPEQQVTLSVYRMALADAKMKSAESLDEERELEHFFHVSTGHSLLELKSILPMAYENWPQISNVDKINSDLKSPAMKKALAEKDLALAELSSARANTWPELKLGAVMKKEETDNNNETLYGFRLVMDLPFFSLNSGGRAYASRGVARFEKGADLTAREDSHERIEQIKVYKSAIQSLNDAPAVQSIEKDFTRNQNLAQRGLISGSLLIEFHRQRSELIRSRNLRELKAIQALWHIRKIDGTIFSETL